MPKLRTELELNQNLNRTWTDNFWVKEATLIDRSKLMISSIYFMILSEKVDFLPERFLSIMQNSFLNLRQIFPILFFSLLKVQVGFKLRSISAQFQFWFLGNLFLTPTVSSTLYSWGQWLPLNPYLSKLERKIFKFKKFLNFLKFLELKASVDCNFIP